MSIVPRTERANFLLDNLDLAKATGIEDAQWEPFQIAHLNDDGPYRIENKSRQIAWSFVIAAEAVAFALLNDPVASSSIFESVNQKEASQKIDYARAVYEALSVKDGLPKLTKDTFLALEFDGGISRGGSTIESLPAVPPRGPSRRNFYGDEFAHVARDRDIYKAALPVTSKGGRFRLGSSPLGASGLCWEIDTQEVQPYPGYTRKRTPWWQCMSFCTDIVVAIHTAPSLTTAERVERFGRPRLQAIYQNMVLEDFQQEYEATFVDETTAWLTWEEIKAATDEKHLCARATARHGNLAEAQEAIEQLVEWLGYGTVETVFSGGFDVGRTRNTSELGLVGHSPANVYPLRLHLSFDNLEFEDQESLLEEVVSKLPVSSLAIDRNGLGMQLAEHMEKRYPYKCKGVDFTNASKKLWATNTKMLFQKGHVRIHQERELSYQLHSIKRLVTGNNNLVFDTEKNEKHHADMFWMLALALTEALKPAVTEYPEPRGWN